MTFKDLVSSISSEHDIPAGTVRKVAKAVVEGIKASVESGEDLRLPALKIKTVTTPAREEAGGKKGRAERKTTFIKLRTAKDSSDS